MAVLTVGVAAVKLLLAHGAYVDPKDRQRRTPLLLSCDRLISSGT